MLDAPVRVATGVPPSHLDLAYRLARRQCNYQHLQDRHDDAELMWRQIADSTGEASDLDASVYARMRLGASMIERGRSADALPVLTECVETIERSGDSETLALALYLRGACACDLGDFERAQRDAELGVALAQQARSSLMESMNLRALGDAFAELGKGSEAVAVSDRALAIATGLGPTYELAALHNVALASTLSGQYERAVAVCMRRIELSQRLGDIRGVAISRAVLGDAYQGLGMYEEAIASFVQATPTFQDHHAQRHHALCLLKLGYAHEGLERYPEAVSYLEANLPIFRRLRLLHKVAEAQRALDRSRAALRD